MNKKDIYYNMFNGGGALIKPTNDGFDLYEIPQYGGVPQFDANYKTLELAKKKADTWT